MPGDKIVSYSPEYSLGAGFHFGDEDMRGRCLDYPRDAVKTLPEPTPATRDGVMNEDGEKFTWETGWGGSIEGKEDRGNASEGGMPDEFFFGDTSNAPMGSIQYSLVEITREKEVRDSLSISGTASIKGGFASASGSFTRSKLDTKNFQYFLLAIKIRTRVTRLDVSKVRFDADVREVPGWKTSDQRREFEERFGDAFVSAVVYGGEFQALFKISKNEVAQVDKFDFSASIKIGPFSGSFGAAVALEEASRNKLVQTELLQVGGKQTVPITQMNNPVQIMEMARAFPASVLSKGGVDAPVRVVVTPYTHLPDYDGPLPAPPRLEPAVADAVLDMIKQFQTLLTELLALGQDPKFVAWLSPGRAGALSEEERSAELGNLRNYTRDCQQAVFQVTKLLVSRKRGDGNEEEPQGRTLEEIVPSPPTLIRLWIDRVEKSAGV